MSDMAASAEIVLTDIEARLTDAGAGLELTLMDRLTPEAITNTRLLRGIHVELPSTAPDGRGRNQEDGMVRDAVVVTLLYRPGPKDQKAGRAQAMRLEDQIRTLLTSRGWRSEWHVTHTGTPSRGPDPASSEVYRIVQTFTTLRDADLGAAFSPAE